MTVELKIRLWVDHWLEKWTNNRPIKIEAILLTSMQCHGMTSIYTLTFSAVTLDLKILSGLYIGNLKLIFVRDIG